MQYLATYHVSVHSLLRGIAQFMYVTPHTPPNDDELLNSVTVEVATPSECLLRGAIFCATN